jgi:hypothetical protein
MRWAGFQEKMAVSVAFADSIPPDDSLPCLTICTNSGIEVAENDKLVLLVHRHYKCLQVFIELVFGLLRICHGGSIRTDDGGITLSFKGKPHMHKPVVQSFGKAGKLADQIGSICEAHFCFATLLTAATAPKKGITCLDLC